MQNVETEYDVPDRLDNDDVYLQTLKILGMRNAIKILNILPNCVAILNIQRQIIYANKTFVKKIGKGNFEESLGVRTGELLACVNSKEHINGCGAARECIYCGLHLTVIKSKETGLRQESTASIIVSMDGKTFTRDFNVIVSPITLNNEIFYIMILTETTE